jgi:type II secretion system protein I
MTSRREPRRAAILLEVIFALALLSAAAATILGSLDASVRTARRLRIAAVAEDLVVTLLSEIQLGLVPAQDDGPIEYEEPYEGWTWEVVTSDLEDVIEAPESDLKRVEVVVVHVSTGLTRRLGCLLPAIPSDASMSEGYVEDYGGGGL